MARMNLVYPARKDTALISASAVFFKKSYQKARVTLIVTSILLKGKKARVSILDRNIGSSVKLMNSRVGFSID